MRICIMAAAAMISYLPMKAQYADLSNSVKQDFVRTWDTYKRYAWGHDVLLPETKSYTDWYEQPIRISQIDAYSSMKVMGLQKQARDIEKFVTDSCNFNIDVYVKTADVNNRVLGGLLYMYSTTRNGKILERARDFGNRLLPAFRSPTGIPYYWVNLKTGKVKGDKVNTAEAAAYTLEMGILSYYTKDPKYYQAARKALEAVYGRRSALNLTGNIINNETGEWVETISCIGAGSSTYYESILKTWLLFKDPELKDMWEKTITAINRYDAEENGNTVWYRRTDMYSGEVKNTTITAYDAYLPALLCLDNDAEQAAKVQHTWHQLWTQYGMLPMIYDFRRQHITAASYELNAEIIESAWYMYDYTKDTTYLEMGKQYYNDLSKYCKTGAAFTGIMDVRSKQQQNKMPVSFFATTMKYLYLLFTPDTGINTLDYIFNAAGNPFRTADFKESESAARLGFQQ
ncbi:glycoside hydrolase family 47 protein [Chitinophaga rhizophila]|uniref:Glycoside hydrolase family 47 protein n=1 Tax=Chitinophaga rhizophila TaxID=2866212 RepID=A0ABS7GIJ9_9BACT|nr:glycoside hydrolase family 47 protein [Chitinophaga rhizophila]MBW8687517.1 glycoside hydrolase family 47 protein [Chitinophaga rhizophila]